MKRNALLSITLIAAALIWSSCTNKNYDATPTIPGKENIRNPFQGDFTAMINGNHFTANTKYVYDSTSNGIRLLAIMAQQYNYNMDTTRYKMISFSIYDYKGPKTYFLAQNAAGIYTDVDSNVTYNYTTVSPASDTLSAVTITTDQSSYQGTFNLMMVQTGNITDTVFISSGQFNIPK